MTSEDCEDSQRPEGTPPVEKGMGVTPAERYLKTLCDRTFLSLWSYPGVYRDQGGGKEVCDLLVVFGDHILIFSDKECSFPDSGNLAQDWNRWYRRAVLKSAGQLFGAERWIRSNPDRLFLDPECKHRFPIDLPDVHSAKFHRILVAHGSSDRCCREWGGSGSLMLASNVVAHQHYAGDTHGGTPFLVGQVNPARGFVHVFDDTSLDIVLRTADTAGDFVSYIEKKERFLSGKSTVWAAGEEDLLAFYLKLVNEHGEHDFVLDGNYKAVTIDEGMWETFKASPERIAQIEADRMSYGWDDLIERFAKHALAGTQYYTTDPAVSNTERVLRFMAAECRLRRRLLSQAYYEFVSNTFHVGRRGRLLPPTERKGCCYVFLVLGKPEHISEEKYREVRRGLLLSYCLVAKLLCPDTDDFVGIATEPGTPDLRSEDCLYYDATTWSKEDEAEAERLHLQEGILRETKGYAVEVDEYPAEAPSRSGEPRSIAMKGRDRNSPCPCGSGRKFKKCCGM